jgi:nucleotide-binding universal stress UspA family protein
MYDKILVPLDGSKRAEAVLHHVADMAQRYHAKVIFLQVIDPGAVVSGMGGSYTVADTGVIQRLVGDADRYLAARCSEFRNQGIIAEFRIGHGDVVQSILSVAQSEGVDLVAMASHGRSGLRRVFYGSVAAGVLNRIDRSLLLIRSAGNK